MTRNERVLAVVLGLAMVGLGADVVPPASVNDDFRAKVGTNAFADKMTEAGSDAERNGSTEMNAAKNLVSASCAKDGVRILFLGNSITLHGSLPKIGWTNVWGMAASAKEKDYVHLVTRGIEMKTGRKADLRVRNLADFERSFRTWEPAENLKTEIAFNPDYLVIALGENVPDLPTQDDRLAYRKAFKGLLGVFMDGRAERPNAVVRGVFWSNAGKDSEMAHVASGYAVPFVRADLGSDPAMTAEGLFWHAGVQRHPGDKGMAAISNLILGALFPTGSGCEARMATSRSQSKCAQLHNRAVDEDASHDLYYGHEH